MVLNLYLISQIMQHEQKHKEDTIFLSAHSCKSFSTIATPRQVGSFVLSKRGLLARSEKVKCEVKRKNKNKSEVRLYGSNLNWKWHRN